MTKWYVNVLYDAAKVFEVEAETKEEAMEKAMNEAGPLNICHQCSSEIELGDPIEAVDAWSDDE